MEALDFCTKRKMVVTRKKLWNRLKIAALICLVIFIVAAIVYMVTGNINVLFIAATAFLLLLTYTAAHSLRDSSKPQTKNEKIEAQRVNKYRLEHPEVQMFSDLHSKANNNFF